MSKSWSPWWRPIFLDDPSLNRCRLSCNSRTCQLNPWLACQMSWKLSCSELGPHFKFIKYPRIFSNLKNPKIEEWINKLLSCFFIDKLCLVYFLLLLIFQSSICGSFLFWKEKYFFKKRSYRNLNEWNELDY